jgi:hypothetical protein
MKLSASQKRKSRRTTATQKARRKALSQPIMLEQVCDFSARLVRVDYGSGNGCWLYTARSVGGGSKVYARRKFNGVWVMAHRFALAVKLGCSIWALEGYDAAHSSKEVCLGGRCCNPDHLTRKLSDPNRSWDRAKDAERFGDKATTRTEEERQTMMKAMYPRGVNSDGKLFDGPWQSNVSPELMRFLETGLKQNLQKMRQYRENTDVHGQ